MMRICGPPSIGLQRQNIRSCIVAERCNYRDIIALAGEAAKHLLRPRLALLDRIGAGRKTLRSSPSNA